MYTDTVNILDSVFYYLQIQTNNQYFPGLKPSDILFLNEEDRVVPNQQFKQIIQNILMEEGILNLFGYIDFSYLKDREVLKEYDLWLADNQEALNFITANRLISIHTKSKIQEILKTEKTRKLLAMKNSNQLNDK